MPRCEWCECEPCFLECAERRAASQRREPWREATRQGVGRKAPKEERQALLNLARALLRRGAEQEVVAQETGLRRDYVTTIAHRLRHGITGGKRKAA